MTEGLGPHNPQPDVDCGRCGSEADTVTEIPGLGKRPSCDECADLINEVFNQ